MPYHETSRKTFVAAGIIGGDSLVKLTEDGVLPCDAGEQPIGVTEVGARMAEYPCGVRLLNTPGTIEVITAADVAVGQELTSAAGGAVVPYAGSGPRVGLALTASVNGGLVEMLPYCVPTVSETGTSEGA